MSYFNEAFFDFFIGLAQHNNRDWFLENKKVYEKEVKKPLYALLGELIDQLGRQGGWDLQVKDAVFRINRDIRFSKDKTPYKLYVSAVVSSGGRKNMQIPGMYLQFGAEEQYIGGGIYTPDKENLQKIRQAIVKSPASYRQLASDPKFLSKYKNGIEGKKIKYCRRSLSHF